MASITKIPKGVLIECDCGASHKLLQDEDGKISIKSTYQKKDENENKKPKEEPDGKPNKEEDDGLWF